MTKAEVKTLLEGAGFKPFKSRESDYIFSKNGYAIIIDVTVKDENLKALVAGKEKLKFPNDRYEIVLKGPKGKTLSSATGFNLSNLSTEITAFKGKIPE